MGKKYVSFIWKDGKHIYTPKSREDLEQVLNYLDLEVLNYNLRNGRLTKMIHQFMPGQTLKSVRGIITDRNTSKRLREERPELFRFKNGEFLPQKINEIEQKAPETKPEHGAISIDLEFTCPHCKKKTKRKVRI